MATLRRRQGVSVYTFGGTPKLRLVAELSRDPRAEPDEKDSSFERLWLPTRNDTTATLYGAVVEGARKLDTQLASEGHPIHSGTLIVIALNPELADRALEAKTRDLVQASPHHYFLLTVGPWAASNQLTFLGKTGTIRAASVKTSGSPMSALADLVNDQYAKEYVISYCSPARAGKRELKLEVTTTDDRGQKSVGAYLTEFDASGFGPGCSAHALPRFVLPNPDRDQRLAVSQAHAVNRPVSLKPTSVRNSESESVKISSTAYAGDSPTRIVEPPRGLGYE